EHAVLGHVDDDEAGQEGLAQQEGPHDQTGPDEGPHGVLRPSGWSSQRSKSFTSARPGRRIFWVPGRISSSASTYRRKRVRSGARRYAFSRRAKASAASSASLIQWDLQ